MSEPEHDVTSTDEVMRGEPPNTYPVEKKIYRGYAATWAFHPVGDVGGSFETMWAGRILGLGGWVGTGSRQCEILVNHPITISVIMPHRGYGANN